MRQSETELKCKSRITTAEIARSTGGYQFFLAITVTAWRNRCERVLHLP